MPEQEEVSVDTSIDTSVEDASPDTEADAETQESEAESTPAVSEDEEKPDSFGSRIKELTDRNRSEKQTSDAKLFELRQENERLSKELKERPLTQEPLKTIEDFDHDETQYREYLDKRTTTIAENAASEAVSKVQTQIESTQAETSFRSRETAFESTVNDYDDAVYGLDANGNRRWPASDAMTDRIRVSDIGPAMAYHLAKNPGTAAEIATLSRDDAVAQMTILEASLKSEKAKVSKSVSDTPPPPPKLPGGETALEKGYHTGMSDAEFNKMRRKEIANR